MNKKMKKMTLRELAPLVEGYHQAFPTWLLAKRDLLVRESGPVGQGLFFERLSYGNYRIMNSIRIFVAPDNAGGMGQLLRSKVSIDPKLHDHYFDQVVRAIKVEFVPKVKKPLVPELVLDLFEEQAIPKSPEAYALAALNAYLGHENRALYWCERFSQLVEELGYGWQEWDIRRRTFIEQLSEWIRSGQAKERLEEILQAERKNWGLKNPARTLQGK